MEIVSLLLNVGILAYLAHLHRHFKVRRLSPKAPKAALPASIERVNPAEKRFDIDGAFTVPLSSRGFVRSFGIRRDQLIDLVAYAAPGSLESFPEDVRGCLVRQYSSGLAFGVEAMELVCKEASLLPGRTLYFALVSTGPESMPEIVTFVDKSQT